MATGDDGHCRGRGEGRRRRCQLGAFVCVRVRSCAFPGVREGCVALEPMIPRSNPPGPHDGGVRRLRRRRFARCRPRWRPHRRGRLGLPSARRAGPAGLQRRLEPGATQYRGVDPGTSVLCWPGRGLPPDARLETSAMAVRALWAEAGGRYCRHHGLGGMPATRRSLRDSSSRSTPESVGNCVREVTLGRPSTSSARLGDPCGQRR